MFYLILFTVIFSLICFLLLNFTNLRKSHGPSKPLKKTFLPHLSFSPPCADLGYIENIFFKAKKDHFIVLRENEVVTENVFLLSGLIEVFLNNKKVGHILKNQITFNCFDFNSIPGPVKIVKREATGFLLENIKNLYIYRNLLYLTALSPFKSLLPGEIINFEKNLFDLEDFSVLSLKRYFSEFSSVFKAFFVPRDREINLRQKLVYIKKGSLKINRVIFKENQVFGYLGLAHRKIYPELETRTIEDTLLYYTDYAHIKDIDIEEVNKNIFYRKSPGNEALKKSREILLVLGSTLKWHRLDADEMKEKIEKEGKSVFLVEEDFYNLKGFLANEEGLDLVARSSPPQFLLYTKNIVKISQSTLNLVIKKDSRIYKSLLGEFFKSKKKSNKKKILIINFFSEIKEFGPKLNKTLFNESELVRKKDIIKYIKGIEYYKCDTCDTKCDTCDTSTCTNKGTHNNKGTKGNTSTCTCDTCTNKGTHNNKGTKGNTKGTSTNNSTCTCTCDTNNKGACTCTCTNKGNSSTCDTCDTYSSTHNTYSSTHNSFFYNINHLELILENYLNSLNKEIIIIDLSNRDTVLINHLKNIANQVFIVNNFFSKAILKEYRSRLRARGLVQSCALERHPLQFFSRLLHKKTNKILKEIKTVEFIQIFNKREVITGKSKIKEIIEKKIFNFLNLMNMLWFLAKYILRLIYKIKRKVRKRKKSRIKEKIIGMYKKKLKEYKTKIKKNKYIKYEEAYYRAFKEITKNRKVHKIFLLERSATKGTSTCTSKGTCTTKGKCTTCTTSTTNTTQGKCTSCTNSTNKAKCTNNSTCTKTNTTQGKCTTSTNTSTNTTQGTCFTSTNSIKINPVNKFFNLNLYFYDFIDLDFYRFARYLKNTSFGLVLGGGGARGFAHIGVLQALEEEKIPIDFIGGTSMGAFIGAVYSSQLDLMKVYFSCKKFVRIVTSFSGILLNLCYPFVSLFSAVPLDFYFKNLFGDLLIEDLWIDFYCITTNLGTSDESIHLNGCLRTFVRASMSICGYLPPVFHNNTLLVDGAYCNNVPKDVMRKMNVKNVIAVDVCETFEDLPYRKIYDAYTNSFHSDEFSPYDYNSGFVLLLKKYLSKSKYLTFQELQYRLTYLTTAQKSKAVEKSTLEIRPDLRNYTPFDFRKIDEIAAIGYQTAKDCIRKYKEKLHKKNKYLRRHTL